MNTLKPPKEKRPRPVESFGPEVMAPLLKGATDGLILENTYKNAVRFRQRIHQLRESMRRLGHSQYELVARVRVTIEWPPDTDLEKSGRNWIPKNRSTKCKIHLSPNDSEFLSMLQKAGVDPLSGILADVTEAPLDIKEDLDTLLNSYKLPSEPTEGS